MDDLRQYFLSITAAAIITAILTELVDKKSGAGSVIKLVCSLFLSFTVIRPIADIKIKDISLISSDILAQSKEAAAFGEEISRDAMATIIKDEAQAYILDKAASLGAVIDAEVILSTEDPPVPQEVYITGTLAPYVRTRLQKVLTEDLGIAKENQIWIP